MELIRIVLEREPQPAEAAATESTDSSEPADELSNEDCLPPDADCLVQEADDCEFDYADALDEEFANLDYEAQAEKR